MNKSKGHVGLIGNREYFIHKESGNLYRVPVNNYVGGNGYRVGARFECCGSRALEHFAFLQVQNKEAEQCQSQS